SLCTSPRCTGARSSLCMSFCFYASATTEIYTLSLHDALPIFAFYDRELICRFANASYARGLGGDVRQPVGLHLSQVARPQNYERSEEHTSELQSRENLVCRLLLEKKKKKTWTHLHGTPDRPDR